MREKNKQLKKAQELFFVFSRWNFVLFTKEGEGEGKRPPLTNDVLLY